MCLLPTSGREEIKLARQNIPVARIIIPRKITITMTIADGEGAA